MQFEANINGQAVVIHYGTNPQGKVAGVWVDDAATGEFVDLAVAQEVQAWTLAQQHHANTQEAQVAA